MFVRPELLPPEERGLPDGRPRPQLHPLPGLPGRVPDLGPALHEDLQGPVRGAVQDLALLGRAPLAALATDQLLKRGLRKAERVEHLREEKGLLFGHLLQHETIELLSQIGRAQDQEEEQGRQTIEIQVRDTAATLRLRGQLLYVLAPADDPQRVPQEVSGLRQGLCAAVGGDLCSVQLVLQRPGSVERLPHRRKEARRAVPPRLLDDLAHRALNRRGPLLPHGLSVHQVLLTDATGPRTSEEAVKTLHV
mmetsp:Transcript_121988/g.304423  ORF Transcript_121988/g.304423 Transcript_121988/m.304423 type:complete len:250 (+) Transcript_121988:175-924(+)